MGLSGCFGSPCIPLGISVDNRVLEIVGLESESGLKMGDFPTPESQITKGAAREN
jgi:hypothetical protein